MSVFSSRAVRTVRKGVLDGPSALTGRRCLLMRAALEAVCSSTSTSSSSSCWAAVRLRVVERDVFLADDEAAASPGSGRPSPMANWRLLSDATDDSMPCALLR